MKTRAFFIRYAALFALAFWFSSAGISSQAWANAELVNRLGIGISKQLKNDIPAISFKMYQREDTAVGLMVNMKTNSQKGGYGAGIKYFKSLFIEPLINFYAAGMFAIVNNKTTTESTTGFQIDATAGSEFRFSGLQSLGFSFEAGLSINKVSSQMSFETTGDTFVTGAIHFYI
jgi:hypothetical protein